jgi:hypothetical protein
MAQCPGCNKFASLDTQDPEVQSISIDKNGTISGEVRIVRNSSCCGYEMKEANFSFEIEPTSEIADHIEAHEQEGTEYILSVEEDGAELTENMSSGVDKKGKPIPYRFRKTFIGFAATFMVNCNCDKAFTISVEHDENMAASEFDELV